MLLIKCPFCGLQTCGPIVPPTGTSYVLTTVDESVNPPSFNPASGLPVKVYGCTNCKKIYLECPSITLQDNHS